MESHTDDDIMRGAQLLQRINPRNVMYRRFVNLASIRPVQIAGKIERELKMHLQYRLDGLTLQEVNRLGQTVVPEAEKIIAEGIPAKDGEEVPETVRKLGRREDHDKLPDEIKKLWDKNGELYKDIKALFEDLKSMEDLPSCERYDKLQLLADMDRKYFAQMQRYDEFVIDTKQNETKPDDDNDNDPAKAVASARAYISKNKAKLAELKENSEISDSADSFEAYKALLQKMQERVHILIEAGEMTGNLRESLEPLGLSFNIQFTGDEDRPGSAPDE